MLHGKTPPAELWNANDPDGLYGADCFLCGAMEKHADKPFDVPDKEGRSFPGNGKTPGLSRLPTLHPHQQLVRTKLSRGQRLFLNIPLTNLIAALAHKVNGDVFYGDRNFHTVLLAVLLDGELEASWSQRSSPTSKGCSPTAAATTTVEAEQAVRSRRRYRERRSPRAAVLC